MARVDFNNLQAFITVARERSFTRAAAQIGVTQSALSHTIRGLEERMGIRLLSRTTRGVSPTEAGERLLANIAHHYEGIEFELAALTELREKPAGTIRLTAHDHAVDTIVWPRLQPFLRNYPDIKVEIGIQYGLVDIVAERFDAGVRSGDSVARDMIAVRIGPDQRMAAVAAPAYLAGRAMPALPHDLAQHDCINLRLPTHGGLYAWEFARDGKPVEVRVGGRLVFNSTPLMLQGRWPAMALPMSRKTWHCRISPVASWHPCCRTGGPPFPAITSITQTGASRHRRFPCLLRPCAGALIRRTSTMIHQP